MLTELQVVNVSNNEVNASQYWEEDTFVLSTCQRNLFLNVSKKWSVCSDEHLMYRPDLFQGPDAYQFLLETICGLQSRVKGECEITAQFKETFQQYLDQESRNPQILKIIQKLFQDAKEVRTKHLKGLGQRSYAAIARKLILKHKAAGPVLVLGSGQLAVDLVLTLKKTFDVHLSGRNLEKCQQLCEQHEVTYCDWKDFSKYANYSAVICAIGCDFKIINDENFFSNWQAFHESEKVFVDFGAPSILETELSQGNQVYLLDDILEAGALQNKERDKKILEAQNAISEILKKRQAYFQNNS